jgi:hypothetical protein
MTIWETSVKALIELFRAALLLLLPTMDKAHIPWREGEAYDDWDEIAEVLYRNIVGRSLQSALGGDPDLDTLLPQYNMKISSYSNRYILRIARPVTDGPTAFIGLSTNKEPFDTVDYVRLDSTGKIIGEILKCSLDEASFEFCYQIGKEQRVITDLKINL